MKKRIISLSFLISLLFSVLSCNKNGKNKEATIEELVSDTGEENLTPSVTEWIIRSDCYLDCVIAGNMCGDDYHLFDICTTAPCELFFAFEYEKTIGKVDFVAEQFAYPFDKDEQSPVATFTKNFNRKEGIFTSSGAVDASVIFFNKTFTTNEHMYIKLTATEQQGTAHSACFCWVASEKSNLMQSLTCISHTYDTYSWIDYNQHQVSCSVCGHQSQTLLPHIVSVDSVSSNGYRTCLLCGGPVNMGFVKHF